MNQNFFCFRCSWRYTIQDSICFNKFVENRTCQMPSFPKYQRLKRISRFYVRRYRRRCWISCLGFNLLGKNMDYDKEDLSPYWTKAIYLYTFQGWIRPMSGGGGSIRMELLYFCPTLYWRIRLSLYLFIPETETQLLAKAFVRIKLDCCLEALSNILYTNPPKQKITIKTAYFTNLSIRLVLTYI